MTTERTTQTHTTKPFLSPRELSTLLTEAGLKVTEERVRLWIRENRIPASRLPGGRHWYIAYGVADAIIQGVYADAIGRDHAEA